MNLTFFLVTGEGTSAQLLFVFSFPIKLYEPPALCFSFFLLRASCCVEDRSYLLAQLTLTQKLNGNDNYRDWSKGVAC